MSYIHPEAEALLNATKNGPAMKDQTPEENRAVARSGHAFWGQGADMLSVSDCEISGVPVRIYVPHGMKREDGLVQGPAFVYCHGGGWVLGGLDSCDSTVRDIAAASEAICISVDYRRAPENPFPAALDDCLAVVDAVLSGEPLNSGDMQIRIDTDRIAVGGDSAGGNITAAIAQGRRQELCHQVLIYPVLDLSSFDTQSHRDFEDGYYLTRSRLEYFYKAYGADTPRETILLSPGLNPDLNGLPPATVITAELDPLVSEVSDYASRMLDAGNSVTAVEFKGQVHPFVQMGGIISDALVARQLIGAELRRAFKN